MFAGFASGEPGRFCDFHLFGRLGQPTAVVIVYDTFTPSGRRHGRPVVTWLEVRSSHDRGRDAAAVITELLAAESHAAGVPVTVYHHDPWGDVYSWSPATTGPAARTGTKTVATFLTTSVSVRGVAAP